MNRLHALLVSTALLLGCASISPVNNVPSATHDLIIRGGTVYDGSGSPGRIADVAVDGDRITVVGNLDGVRARNEINARGLAVSPGFINMLSWATESLIQDGRGMSDIMQGVTLEVFGEGSSMGPLNDAMKKEALEQMGDIKYPIEWTTLGQYLEYLVKRGISPNVASFVGATTVRIHELGYADRAPNPQELARMQALVRQAMEEGALGVGSSLIYAPAFYAKTDELIALSKAAAPYGGSYISHMRSEGARLLESVDELMRISREAGVGAEIYHLKAAGKDNWSKLPAVIAKVDSARAAGADIRANMYTYTAGATGLDASMPPWVQEGGYNEWAKRLKDPAIRARVAREMRTPTDKWENFFAAVESPEKIVLVGFRNDSLKPLTGKTLSEVARMRGKTPEETAMDLVIQDGSRVDAIYFLMSEENVRRQMAIPWVSFGSDAQALAPEGVFLKSSNHPRAYGNVARVLGHYVRDEKIIPLEAAIRRLTSLPAHNLKITNRGELKPGYFADIAVFDPRTVGDRATFESPRQYATGMTHVFVNGQQVLKNGVHTGAKPGMVVRGPGWKKNPPSAQVEPPKQGDKASEFNAYVKRAVAAWKAPGLAIAVVKDGRVQFASGYGVREVGKAALVDTSTLFAIASTTKAMTAAAMGMLVDEGKVKWDDKVIDHLPGFQLYDPWATREVTIRDLLTHRAGLGNADYLWAVSDLPANTMLSRLRLLKPEYSLRSSFIYQNVMYITAGEVIAAASGMSWDKFLQTRIFDPLGMKRTYTRATSVPAGANAATPHYRYGGDTIAAIRGNHYEAIGPAGDVWSNVADMSRWMLFLLDSGRVNSKALLKPQTFAELLKPQVMVPPAEFYPTAQLTKPHWTTYGLGWFQHDYQGRMLNFHTGSLDGTVAIIGLIPDERFGVYVLSNSDHVEIRHALMYKAIDLYLGNPQRDWSTDLLALYGARQARGDSTRRATEARRIKGTKPTLPVSKYAGVYEDSLFGRITVTDRDGKLRVQAGPTLAGNLEHWEYDRFRVRYDDRWQGSDVISFAIGNGVASSLKIAGFTLRRAESAGVPAKR